MFSADFISGSRDFTQHLASGVLSLIHSAYSCLRARVQLKTTVAHRGHRFHKEKTLQIKKFLANINNTSKKSSPAHCKQERNCIKIHAHYNQKNYTLQT